jgi:hypothetical protein
MTACLEDRGVSTSSKTEFPMVMDAVAPLRRRMIEVAARRRRSVAIRALRGLRSHGHRLQQFRNRDCPECQGAAAKEWLAARGGPPSGAVLPCGVHADGGVSSDRIDLRWNDYHIEGANGWKTMTLTPHEFIRRFLKRVVHYGFHRIRHYGPLVSGTRAVDHSPGAPVARRTDLPRPQRQTNRACCDVRAPAAARPCSSWRRGCQPKHRSDGRYLKLL